MNFFEILPVFILGLVVGSFLNVVIYRYNSGVSPLKGRSLCFTCGKTLFWYELIPLVSFIMQKGRCRKCRAKISLQYPFIEALTGVMFAAVFLSAPSIEDTIFLIAVFSILIVITGYDLRHQIIPDGLVAGFSLLSLGHFIFLVGVDRIFHFPYLWTLLAGPLLFIPFWALWRISEGRWLGLGDGKLALGIGWFLGITLGGSAIMLAFWIGAIYALILMGLQHCGVSLSGKKLTFKSEIPFGPFLVLGTIIIYFTQLNFFDGSILLTNLL